MEYTSLYTILYFVETIGVLFLLYYGSFIKTRHFRYARLFFAFIIVGALFKIMHWEFQNIFMLIGFLGILVLYIWSFVEKPVKNRLDYLKLAWAVFDIPYRLLIYFHMVKRDYVIISQIIIFFALLEYFKAELHKSKQKMR